MDLLVDILYFLSTALLVPVIIVLLGFVVWSLLEIGGFAREVWERHRQHSACPSFLTDCRDQPHPPQTPAAAFFPSGFHAGLFGAFSARFRESSASELHLGKLISDLEIEAASRLARMQLGVRVGPMLGLMGTLIPLGPALTGISRGNIEEMTHHLVVAFSTTVLGLFVGGTCYGIWLIRRQWYARDLADIEYVCRCFEAGGGEQHDELGDEHRWNKALFASTTARKP